MVHARRKLFELAAVGKAPIAAEAVRRIDELFAIERDISGKPAAERLALRTKEAKPLVLELEAWLRAQHGRVSRKSETGKALAYALNHWEALTRYLKDGRICMSNNAAERALRGVAVGRRNWTFAGSDRGGERAAAIYTLVETAKLNGVDPQAWLADVLARLPDHPVRRIDELLPWNWRPPAGPPSPEVAAAWAAPRKSADVGEERGFPERRTGAPWPSHPGRRRLPPGSAMTRETRADRHR